MDTSTTTSRSTPAGSGPSSAEPTSTVGMAEIRAGSTCDYETNAPVDALTSPPRVARALVEDHEARDHRQGYNRPPMSVVVVSTPVTDADHSLPPTASSARPSPSNKQGQCDLSSSVSPFSAPFRLQPRRGMSLAVTKPGTRGEASRGRKRSAQSMSTSAARDSLLTAKTVPTPSPLSIQERTQVPGMIFTDGNIAASTAGSQRVYGGTPPRGKRSIGNALFDFQCLSLQSPKRSDPPVSAGQGTPPRSSQDTSNATLLPPSSSYSCSPKRPATVANSVGSLHSQATPPNSTMPPSRSSFTPVLSAASPGGCSMRSYGSGSIGSNSRINAGVRTSFSPGAVSAKSSPKIASLTVLQDKGTKVLPLPSKESDSRLPPSEMNSLWLSLESSSDSESDAYSLSPRKDSSFRMLPPKTVHCRNPSFDTMSTVQNCMLSPAGFPSPSSFPCRHEIPRCMQTRPQIVDQFVSPRDRSPKTPQTPLPRVTLTPRSTGSRHSSLGGTYLPRFPSPSDADMDVTSPFLSTAATTSLRGMQCTESSDKRGSVADGNTLSAIQCLFPGSSTSLALSADGSAREEADVLPSKSEDLGGNEAFSGGTYMGIQTRSLLSSSRSGGMLKAMMEEDEKKAGAADFGSVSDIDEDEGFILAAPSAIEEERFASYQPARQRKRRSIDRLSHTSPNLSNSNLAGMNYVTSNTSLFGMDIAHPSEATGVMGSSESKAHLDSSNNSVPQAGANSVDMPESHNRHKSETSFASIGLALEGTVSSRDLVTPPPMASPQIPPALSPREGYPLSTAHRERMVEHRSNQANVCVVGADRRSVTMAIAKMAFEAKHHSESSPVL